MVQEEDEKDPEQDVPGEGSQVEDHPQSKETVVQEEAEEDQEQEATKEQNEDDQEQKDAESEESKHADVEEAEPLRRRGSNYPQTRAEAE